MGRNGRRSGNPLWLWASLVGLIVFLFIQVFPVAWNYDSREPHPLTRNEAAAKALQIAADRFGIPSDQVSVVITYMTDSTAVGYFSKEQLLNRYEKEWSKQFPADVYRADLHLPSGGGTLTLFLHMESGKLVGWRDEEAFQRPEMKPAQETPERLASRALSYAAFWGVRADDWEWNGQDPVNGTKVTFLNRKAGVGEARLWLDVIVPADYNPAASAFPAWKNGAVSYDIKVPDAFQTYLQRQQSLSANLNAYGFVVPQLLLLLMAIIYSATRREYTTFRRGIALSALFFVMYAAFYLNMIPGFRAGLFEQGASDDRSGIAAALIVNFIILAGMAAFTYFSAVGGDGLWKSMGRSLWPRWREADFGKAVRSGVRTGYLLAFLLLGVQSVILVALSHGIGMFQSSDASQSTYNMTLPWLLLLLAWCAGISEELQSRLFGIGLFRSWLVGAAGRILGRKPSPRAVSALTMAAAFPPGLFWAFGHVSYAVYPAYSRLIELIIMGMLFGWFMLRFGLIAVIFAHVVLDSILMGVQMVFDGLPGDLPAGLIGFILPAIVGWAIGWVHRQWRRTPVAPPAG